MARIRHSLSAWPRVRNANVKSKAPTGSDQSLSFQSSIATANREAINQTTGARADEVSRKAAFFEYLSVRNRTQPAVTISESVTRSAQRICGRSVRSDSGESLGGPHFEDVAFGWCRD